MRDPAFLFYTKDFQSGTQDMSCEEIGAYLRLLMYQHQHGSIPKDKDRLMRISGIFSTGQFEMVWQTLNRKFDQKDDHLVNQRLAAEVIARATAKPKKLAASVLAGLISTAKHISLADKYTIKKAFQINDFILLKEEEMKSKIKEWFNKMVDRLVDNLGDGDGIVNENRNDNGTVIGKGGVGENPNIVSPFESKTFSEHWTVWKTYLVEQHEFLYLSEPSEQAALMELATLSNYDQTSAIATINHSMANGWKGFFEVNQQHGSTKQPSGKGSNSYSDTFKRKIAERLQSG
jgi:uncharacterized protein YdaU (DUF1376 family)